jgi:hypothetical protein
LINSTFKQRSSSCSIWDKAGAEDKRGGDRTGGYRTAEDKVGGGRRGKGTRLVGTRSVGGEEGNKTGGRGQDWERKRGDSTDGDKIR